MSQLKITLTKSGISFPLDQKRTLQALGLKRMHQTVVQPDHPAIRGMITKVQHLVTVVTDASDQTAENE